MKKILAGIMVLSLCSLLVGCCETETKEEREARERREKWEKFKENAWEFTKDASKRAIESGAKYAGEKFNEYVEEKKFEKFLTDLTKDL